MWTYSQASGELQQDDEHVGYGYAGEGMAKNNPLLQHIHGEGPLPRGRYKIGEPHDSGYHGPFVMQLLPDEDNEMFGRSGFLMHGDSKEHPGGASRGCIVLDRRLRELVAGSGDKDLLVVA